MVLHNYISPACVRFACMRALSILNIYFTSFISFLNFSYFSTFPQSEDSQKVRRLCVKW